MTKIMVPGFAIHPSRIQSGHHTLMDVDVSSADKFIFFYTSNDGLNIIIGDYRTTTSEIWEFQWPE